MLLLFLVPAGAWAQHHHGQGSSNTGNTPGSFDYYLLALSWAPEYCATHSQNASSSECDPHRHYGLVVHGMWPQNDDGSYPQHCAPAQPVSNAIVQQMLPIIPARGLIQHEWETHGTCSGLSTKDYFDSIEKVFRGLQVPAAYQKVDKTLSVSPQEIEQQFADANHAPAGAFRIHCSNGELIEVQACFSKDLAYRDCGNLRDCRSRQITVRPTP